MSLHLAQRGQIQALDLGCGPKEHTNIRRTPQG